MLFTKCGCLLLVCSVLAVCLFCWLSYSIIVETRASPSGKSKHTGGSLPHANVADSEGATISG